MAWSFRLLCEREVQTSPRKSAVKLVETRSPQPLFWMYGMIFCLCQPKRFLAVKFNDYVDIFFKSLAVLLKEVFIYVRDSYLMAHNNSTLEKDQPKKDPAMPATLKSANLDFPCHHIQSWGHPLPSALAWK